MARLFVALLLLVPTVASAQSLDLALAGHGVSLGNSPRFTGLRLNVSDRGVQRIDGLNLTLWNPKDNPDAVYNGVTLGLVGIKARHLHGLAVGGIGVNARERISGIAAGTLGVAAQDLDGLAAGLFLVDVRRRVRGIAIAGFWTGEADRFEGLALSAGGATADDLRGIGIGGLFTVGTKRLDGVALAGGTVFSERLRGLAVGGIGVGGLDVDGVAASFGGIGGARLDGIFLAGLGTGASERLRGIAVGGVLVFARETQGITVGALNGLYVDRIDLEDFLHFNLANRRATGLSIGLVNYTAELKGVQIGLLNYAKNNPRWLRLLPLVNLHL